MVLQRSAPLSTRLGFDSIREWQRAATRQWNDAEILRKNKRRLAAVYLYGYVAEILIKGAHFRLYKSLDDEIKPEDRTRAISNSQPRTGHHDIAGWAKLLVQRRIEMGQPNSNPSGDEIINNANILYLNWRETIRYHATRVRVFELNQVREKTLWFRKNYPRL